MSKETTPYFQHHFVDPEQQYESSKLGMWAFLVTEVLTFAGLFCAYAILRAKFPDTFELCGQLLNANLGLINTIVLITSSLTMALAIYYIQNDNQKISEHSMITEINGYRTKKILEDFKYKYFSPFVGNDVVEMNSIISKYIAAATFDIKNTDLINLLFKRVHTLKSHTLLDKSLSTTFCELEKYFQNKNEVLIGIIDYDFSSSRRKIKNISINPEQIKQIDLDEGDRLITITNFNDLEMVKQIRYLYML